VSPFEKNKIEQGINIMDNFEHIHRVQNCITFITSVGQARILGRLAAIFNGIHPRACETLELIRTFRPPRTISTSYPIETGFLPAYMTHRLHALHTGENLILSRSFQSVQVSIWDPREVAHQPARYSKRILLWPTRQLVSTKLRIFYLR